MLQNIRRHQIFITLISMWMSVYFSVVVRLFDFLKYISTIYESLILPLSGLCIGLLIGRYSVFTLSRSLKGALLLFLLLSWGIYLNSATISLAFAVLVFVTIGISLRRLSQDIPPSKLYSFESAGYLIGLVAVQLVLPIIGIEILYLGLLVAIFLVDINLKTNRILTSVCVLGAFLAVLVVKNIYGLTIYSVTKEINIRHLHQKKTIKNASYILNTGQGHLVETIWTSGDRLDVVRVNDITHLYFSNILYSSIPTDLPKEFTNEVTHARRALVLGMGGGIDLLQLENAGYRNSTALEIYPELVDALKNRYVPNLLQRNNIIVQDLNYYVQETKDKYDIILHSFPDIVAKVDSSGWPIENATYSVRTLTHVLQRLNPSGILLIKMYYSRDNPWASSCYEAARDAMTAVNLHPDVSMRMMKIKNHVVDPLLHRTMLYVAIKNGEWKDSDLTSIQAIEPLVTDLDESDTEMLDIFHKKLGENTTNVREALYNTLYQSIYQKNKIMIVLAAFFLLIIAFSRFFEIIWSTKRICFFSGVLYAAVEILSAKKLSFHFPNPFTAINWVFAIFALTFWFSNYYLSKRLTRYSSLLLMTPIVAAFLLIVLLDYNIDSNLQWVIVFMLGLFSAYNFSAVIHADRDSFASLLTYNSIGFACGSGIIFLFFREGVIANSFYILTFCAFYALLCIQKLIFNSKLKK